MPLQTNQIIVGVAKQASAGTLAANPTFAHGVTGGTPVSVEANQSPLEVTSSKRAYTNVIREGVANGASITAPAYLKTLGLWLLGAIGTSTDAGSAGAYTHTYATGDLPYLSVFTKGIAGTIEAIRDCKVDELSLKWDNSKPLELSVKVAGTVFSYPASFTAGTDETGSESFLVPVGGTFQYDVIGSTPVTARVTGGELTIKNNVSPVDTSASIEHADQWEGVQEHELKLTVVPDDLSDFRKTITGTSSGTGATSVVPTGSVTLSFKENNGTGTLGVTGTKVAFLTAFPDADPKGGAASIELVGTAVLPSGGTAPLVYLLTNATQTY